MALPLASSNETIPEWARKPLLGFSTWSTQILDNVPGYGGKHIKPWFDDKAIREISDVMRARMPQYEYINLDSGWCDSLDEYGRWVYRHDLFPDGLRSLSDYLSQNGHKLGLYLLPGIRKDAVEAGAVIKGTDIPLSTLVKQKKQGNGFKNTTYMPDEHNEWVQKYYDSLAELLASWNVKFVKIDGCGPSGEQGPDTRVCLSMMAKAFEKYGVWMNLSWYLDPKYAQEWSMLANGARVYIDIESYSTRSMTTSYRVFQRISQAANWVDNNAVGSHRGFFIDLDAVLVGMTVNGKCIDGLDNDDVRRSYVSFWSLVSSIFCIGADPRMLPDKYLNMLNNPEILEIHRSGIMAHPIRSGNVWMNRKQVWWKRMQDGRVCCGLFNAHVYPFMLGKSHRVKFNLADVELKTAVITDVWTGECLGTYTDKYCVVLRPGQCQMLLLESK
ncbi:hypothetical protein DFQ28_002388 [Apophysomyces sp. BC1034]|nr:hypothetical protein DFQ30_002939 [Apophysomyces sp. BC1015]KAG0179178.1 hypothetical protein DFQ29_002433 [Apophysomyces sp. BC1021]KAG0190201.1 hypothetical protein DFQ28_002388 [Apophysomyces sp. BC1034]